MKGWIIYKRSQAELTEADHGVIRFLQTAKNLHLQLAVYRPEEFDLIANSPANSSVFLNGQPCDLPDFVIPRTGADTSYHALTLLRQLELQGVCSINTAASIDYVRDKMRVSQLLAQHDLPAPKTMLLKFPVNVELIKRHIGFPLVVKTLAGMRGIGVFLCENETIFADLMGVLSVHNNQKDLILQQFIASSYGRDLRVFVLNNEIIGCMQRTAKNSFKANYSLGGEVTPFAITPELAKLSIQCAQLFGLEIAGIDLLFTDHGFMICEANSSPGFKGMELANQTDIAERILHYVMNKVNARRHLP